MNAKQKRFVEEFLIDLNGKQAAIRAGYSARTAEVQASRLLSNAKVKAAVDAAKAQRSKETKIDAEYVLKQSVKLHERCMQEVRPKMVKIGKDYFQASDENGNPVFLFDSSGAAKALELIGKHVNVQSFNEKKSMTLDLEDATREELEAELAALTEGDK